jgi:hypothetical protein
MLVLSYIPLFLGSPRELLPMQPSIIREIQRLMDCAPHVRACLWTEVSSEPTPVFAVDRAGEVVQHIRTWSEGHPEEWFALHVRVDPVQRRYHVALAPDLRKSKTRFTADRRTLGKPLPDDIEIVMVCLPLAFTYSALGVAAHLTLPARLRLGFLDGSVDLRYPSRLPDPEFLGPFQVNPPDQPSDDYLGDLGPR